MLNNPVFAYRALNPDSSIWEKEFFPYLYLPYGTLTLQGTFLTLLGKPNLTYNKHQKQNISYF